jgi:hypothetical protein
MQHSKGADGLVSSTVSQVHAGCKHQSSSVAACDETAGAGAKRPRANAPQRPALRAWFAARAATDDPPGISCQPRTSKHVRTRRAARAHLPRSPLKPRRGGRSLPRGSTRRTPPRRHRDRRHGPHYPSRERFAEKLASGSRPRRVVRRWCFRPKGGVRVRRSLARMQLIEAPAIVKSGSPGAPRLTARLGVERRSNWA